jgi:hypothetical protein
MRCRVSVGKTEKVWWRIDSASSEHGGGGGRRRRRGGASACGGRLGYLTRGRRGGDGGLAWAGWWVQRPGGPDGGLKDWAKIED